MGGRGATKAMKAIPPSHLNIISNAATLNHSSVDMVEGGGGVKC
jgi:hypothetical protein